MSEEQKVNQEGMQQEPEEQNSDQSLFLKPVLLIIATIIIIGGWTIFMQKRAPENNLPEENSNQEENNNPEAEAEAKVKAIDFSLYDTEGNLVKLSEVSASAVLTFWHTGCSWCVKQMPDLYEVAGSNPEVQFLAVAIGDKKEDLAVFEEGRPENLKILMDADYEIVNEYEVSGTPTHFLLDEKSEILGIDSGYHTAADFQAMINQTFNK